MDPRLCDMNEEKKVFIIYLFTYLYYYSFIQNNIDSEGLLVTKIFFQYNCKPTYYSLMFQI